MSNSSKFAFAVLVASTCIGATDSADSIDVAADRLKRTQIEDDIGLRQFYLTGTETAGCTTLLRGEDAELRIDWATTEVAGMSEGFIWIKAPPRQLAIVTTIEVQADIDNLRALSREIGLRAKQCTESRARTDQDAPQ